MAYPVLWIRAPTGEETKFPMQADVITIGREADNDLVVNAAGVSRNHARFYMWEGQLCVEDLGSSNGTFVNGEKITDAVALDDSSEVDVGGFLITTGKKRPQARAAGPQPRAAAPQAAANLVCMTDRWANKAFPITAAGATIGRVDTCEIPIPDNSVSRNHARVSVRGQVAEVEDLGSSNGTFVNDQRVTKKLLVHGDVLRTGRIEFQVQLGGRVEPAAPPAHAAPAAATSPVDPKLLALMIGMIVVILLLLVVLILRPKDAGDGEDDGQTTAAKTAAEDPQIAKARAAIEKQQWDEALALVAEVLNRDPINKPARLLKSGIEAEKQNKEIYLSGETSFELGREEDAYKTFLRIPTSSFYYNQVKYKISELREKLAKKYLAQGKGAYQKGNVKEAQTLFAQYLDFNPTDQETVTLLRSAEQSLRIKNIAFTPWAPPEGAGSMAASAAAIKAAMDKAYPDADLRDAIDKYFKGELDPALRALMKLKDNNKFKDKDQGLAMIDRLLTVKGKYTEGQGHYLQGRLKEARVAWEKVLDADKALIPEGLNSFYRDEVTNRLAEGYYKAGLNFYNTERFPEAFELWIAGYNFAPQHLDTLNGLTKLEKVADRLYAEGIHLEKTQDPAAKAKFMEAAKITRKETAIHQKASEKIK